jgi:uncharacterized Zn finger protein
MSKAGTTWWGQRWIEALESLLGGDSGRLSRGRTYARAGRTHDLAVKGGTVTAKVTGSRDEPYAIEIRLAQLSEPKWVAAIAQMAEKAQFTAELLAGAMPREIDSAFRAAGVSLFPQTRAELKTKCSCPDWGDPCKHVAATHYILGEVFDRDPFLLFELRGRTKAEVLAALRAARGGTSAGARDATAPAGASSEPSDAVEIPRVTFGKLAAGDYDRAPEALPSLQFSFDAPTAHGAVLRQLGAPAAWSAKSSPADALSPLVQRAAEAARRIAMAEAEPPSETAAPEATTREPTKRAPARREATNRKATAAATKSEPKRKLPKRKLPKRKLPKRG